MNQPTNDVIFLAVQPREDLSRVIRLATTAVAGRCGLNIDQADDLNTAIDEIFHTFITLHQGNAQQFCVRYLILPDRLEVQAEDCGGYADTDDSIGRYNRFLIESLSDHLEERENVKGGHDLVLTKLLPQH